MTEELEQELGWYQLMAERSKLRSEVEAKRKRDADNLYEMECGVRLRQVIFCCGSECGDGSDPKQFIRLPEFRDPLGSLGL